ncbi:MAG: 16S rRNA (adenine(1518)-N(6)/adenine(1519)-N(6))-dimethyltransferase RsmA [Bryobacterales bacterium]|nr:16S rRNA (adenine(1518)-N(6)/adenine(1519)-N(6))-dimethyltransferase RsmA [Bryobacteraceae bacterium]MDW8354263.1 16S rRNA (adenine(1518)-N(6)/adenine(1519)-N(6))-dimethyltransferase RsmA [Bryobacterales bacterium]
MGRRLGQHFLTAKPLLERIAREACPEYEPRVIEIGAGTGSLTACLLERAASVIAIEKDPALAARLAERFAGAAQLQIVQADVLALDLGQWGPAVVAGNLPYYITSPILDKVLALGAHLRRAVLLLQKEVAERLTAPPRDRAYGFLTVRTRLFAEPEILFLVGRRAFRPPPQVDSALVRLVPVSPEERWGITDPHAFLRFAARCFRQKRKTIRNNLERYYGPALQALPEASRRAEELSIEQLARLWRELDEPVLR